MITTFIIGRTGNIRHLRFAIFKRIKSNLYYILFIEIIVSENLMSVYIYIKKTWETTATIEEVNEKKNTQLSVLILR